MKPSEDELHAYVDGQLPPERRAAVEARLAQDAEAAAAVAAWRRQNELIRALYEPGSAAVPARIEAALYAPPRRAPWRSLAAGILLVMLGGAAGWQLRGSSALAPGLPPLAARGIEAHNVYASEVRHPVEVGANEEAHLVQWLSKRLGYAVKAPDLTGLGLRLLGGRLLPGAGSPAAQFMYESEDGGRYTLYCTRETGRSETAFRFAASGDAAAFYWIDDHSGYALVGPNDRERLLRIARAVYEALEGNQPSNSGPRTL